MKGLINFVCCFIPVKKWRKKVRSNLMDSIRRRNELLNQGFKIDNGIITTPEGVRLNISDKSDHPFYLVKEVFVKNEYKLILRKESILFDIGMNRGAASLLFATNKNIKKIFAYEPFKPTVEAAKRNLGLNPQLSEKIKVYNVGLGKEETTLELPYMANATGGMSTTHDVCGDAQNTTKETVIIKDAAKEIARVLEENTNKHVIMKCDCEGAEFDIFNRLDEKRIFKKIDVIMMEYHFENPEKLVDILADNGFAIQIKSGSTKSKTGYIYAVRTEERHRA
jgi:FkbM family methyltransferase